MAIKAPAAMERLLGVSRESSKLGFWRSLVGLSQSEQWTVLKASSSSKGLEEGSSRGTAARLGDLLLLQAAGASSGDHYLSLHESAEGQHPRLVHKDRVGLGLEVWQVELFASQPLPSWFNRPYLR